MKPTPKGGIPPPRWAPPAGGGPPPLCIMATFTLPPPRRGRHGRPPGSPPGCPPGPPGGPRRACQASRGRPSLPREPRAARRRGARSPASDRPRRPAHSPPVTRVVAAPGLPEFVRAALLLGARELHDLPLQTPVFLEGPRVPAHDLGRYLQAPGFEAPDLPPRLLGVHAASLSTSRTSSASATS